MKVFLFQGFIIHLLVNRYVFLRGWQVLPKGKGYRIPYTLLFVSELIIYFIGAIFNVKLPHEVLKPILLVGTSWMILIGYMAAFLVMYDTVIYAQRWIKKIRYLNLHSLTIRRWYMAVAFLIVVVAMIHGNYRFRHPVVTELNLTVDKKVDSLETLRVVVVSDIHTGHMVDKGVLSMYVDKIMEQKPDLVLLVGDIIDHSLTPLLDQKMDEEFRRLKAPYGVYVSTGNHEYRLNGEEKIAWLATQTGMTMLRDTAVNVANKFYLVGREDYKALRRKQLADIMQAVDKRLPVIVMNHQPRHLSEEAAQQVDLAVYGHTHNGQLFPNNIIINLLYEVGYGYKKKDNTHVYVTSGLGLAGPQYRIGTLSEIAVINLHFRPE